MAPQRRDIVARDPSDRDSKRAARPPQGAVLAFKVVARLAKSGGRIEVPMKKRTDHFDAVHTAELAALIVTIQLAAALSFEAIACRLLRALDDEPAPSLNRLRAPSDFLSKEVIDQAITEPR